MLLMQNTELTVPEATQHGYVELQKRISDRRDGERNGVDGGISTFWIGEFVRHGLLERCLLVNEAF